VDDYESCDFTAQLRNLHHPWVIHITCQRHPGALLSIGIGIDQVEKFASDYLTSRCENRLPCGYCDVENCAKIGLPETP
ncbi:uncharacterized protein METZ01_LOCUS517724, partial [marine metagenome]